MEHEAKAINCWAPEIIYDEEKSQYVIFWATTIPGRFADTDGQDKRSGDKPGWNHRIYYVTSKDMKSFSETNLFFDQGFNAIDASILKDGSKYVMFVKDETNVPFTPQKNIRVTKAEHVEGPYAPVSKSIHGDYWAEGPTAIRISGIWIVYFDKYRLHKYGAVSSTDRINWQDISDRISFPEGTKHGTVLRVSEQVLNRLLEIK
jgi:hypothetical protein